MIVSIDAADPRPIYIQIVDEVRRGIVLGTLVADAPLPSVRQMAADLRVNPNTVAQAYRELERESVVYVKRGQGTFVSPGAISDAEGEKISLAKSVAQRALTEAYRHGLTREDLVTALEKLEVNND